MYQFAHEVKEGICRGHDGTTYLGIGRVTGITNTDQTNRCPTYVPSSGYHRKCTKTSNTHSVRKP